MAPRTLVIIRHAKSAWPEGVPDVRRPLSPRGRRDAPEIGRWLTEHGIGLRRAWISPAARTQQTWALVAANLPDPAGVSHETDPSIYAAPLSDLLAVVAGLPDDLEVAALVGHNPGCEDLASFLAGAGSDPDAVAGLRVKYPTAGVAVIELAGPWSTVGSGPSRLVHFAVPRG